MAFTIDGSVHHEAIKEEKETVNDRELFKENLKLSDNFEVTHKGGTQNKADMEVKDGGNEWPISMKKKKKLSQGSHDYINSSSALSDSCFNNVKELARDIRELKLSKTAARKKFTDVCHDTMKNMTSQILKDILIKHVSDPYVGMHILIKETSSNSIYFYKFDDTPLANSIKNHTPKFQWGRGKTSAKIIFEDENGNIHDYNLRGRLVSNNGVSAMLGESSSNNSSIPVFKVQQDRVDKVIDGLIKKNIAAKWR